MSYGGIKILRRTARPSVVDRFLTVQRRGPVALPSFYHAAKSVVQNAASEIALFVPKVMDSLRNLGANIDMGTLVGFLTSVKPALIVALGVAGVAAIIYLVYKAVRHPEQLQQVKNDLIRKFHSISPTLFSIEGWTEKISDKLDQALSGSPSDAISKIGQLQVDISASEPLKIGTPSGSGLEKKRTRKGGNIITPIY